MTPIIKRSKISAPKNHPYEQRNTEGDLASDASSTMSGGQITVMPNDPIVALQNQVARLTAENVEMRQMIDEIKAKIVSLPTIKTARPKSVQSSLQKDATAIDKSMKAVYNRILKEIYRFNRTGSTSDDLSEAMVDFIRPIQDLREKYGPASASTAFDLVMKLRSRSHGGIEDMPKACGYGDRPSDELADQLALSLIKELNKAKDQNLDVKALLADIKSERKYLEEYGVEP